MKPREFFDLVSSMRDAQKSYFKSRGSYDLQKSKELEKKVDDEIERVNRILEGRKGDVPENKPINRMTGQPVTLEDLEDNFFKCDQLCNCKNCDFRYGEHDGCFDVQEKVEKLRMAIKKIS